MRKPTIKRSEGTSGLPETTGRYLVLVGDGAEGHGLAALENAAGIKAALSLDFPDRAPAENELAGARGLLLASLGVAVVDADPDQVEALRKAAGDGAVLLSVEQERICRAIPIRSMAPVEEAGYTWGLTAVGVPGTKYTGKGVRVAVLDTGFDFRHPDFPHRQIVSKSFVPGELPQDGMGHGTHCIGTACGPMDPYLPPRYGIAYEATILVGKVLDNSGGGADGWILSGLEWAVTQKADVVSMSLGAAVAPGTKYSRVFETVARRLLAQGSLVVAAAGNESDRRIGRTAPVGHPANCPSVLAVGAIDSKMQLGYFSNRSDETNPGDAGAVDLVAPGVDVHSSWPMPERYRRLSGTSMATPHVAGIAALHAEANPKSRGKALWQSLTANAHALPLPKEDAGAGLVQAPPVLN